MNVQNELGVIVTFAQACEQRGWKINHIQAGFPDAIIQDEKGDTYRAEFEFCASNFKTHGHDLCQCDVIICWENDWPDCLLTIWSLKDWSSNTISLCDRKDLMIASLTLENGRLKRKVDRLSNAVRQEQSEIVQTSTLERREHARLILADRPKMTGLELAGILDCSGSFARRLKREIQGNGHKAPQLEVAK